MAGDWIKMRTNLDTNPHVIAMAATLGIPELHVVGGLWKVWSWVDTHSLDGNALCVTSVTLDRFTGVTGFADAMRSVGWLEGPDGQICFPRFTEHNGKTAKNRAETAERVAKHRNAKGVTDVTPKPLPEKRREDITGPGPKPCRVNASEQSKALIAGRDQLAAVIVRPLPPNGMTNGRATAAIDTVTDRVRLAEWWRKHLGTASPLTGPTALDLLHVLCCAVECSRCSAKNKVAAFCKRLTNGEWVKAETNIPSEYQWLSEQINTGRIEVEAP